MPKYAASDLTPWRRPTADLRLLALLTALVLAALAMAACGGDSPEGGKNESGATQGAFPRTVAHAMGPTEIRAAPKRVVVLDTGELDSMIALGVTPVGAVRAPVDDGLLDYLQEDTRNTQLVGTISAPNLEAIAALKPDLILSSKLRHAALYDELSRMAPTVFTEAVGVVWKDNLRVHSKAVGKEAEAERMLADYHNRAQSLGADIQKRYDKKPTISLVRFMPNETRLYQKASFIGTVLQDVGLPRPPAQDVDSFALKIGPEQISQAGGDIVLVSAYGPAEKTPKPTVTSNPLWQQLAPVREGKVHEVADDRWMLGIGIRAANLVLDDLERMLLKEAPNHQ